MQTKSLTIEKMDEAGTGLARIARLSAVDSDGDTYERGAFAWKEGGGQWVQILPAHDRRAMPLGKAWIYEDGDQALAQLHLNLETQAGKDWHATLKFDLATGNPVQEWSYGYQVLDADFQVRGEQRVQVLKRLDVDEISPVIRGAGVGTGTLSMKDFGSIKSAELKEKHFAPLIAALGELAQSLPADPSSLSATGLKQLEEIERAIGAALAPMRQLAAKERMAADSAIAGYLKLQSRRHLPASR